jgi:hypothetical protein
MDQPRRQRVVEYVRVLIRPQTKYDNKLGHRRLLGGGWVCVVAEESKAVMSSLVVIGKASALSTYY